jgi:hypothetical protein
MGDEFAVKCARPQETWSEGKEPLRSDALRAARNIDRGLRALEVRLRDLLRPQEKRDEPARPEPDRVMGILEECEERVVAILNRVEL